ncbi:RNA polymerase factor sigma-54 [Paenibacillus humicus]|uniref:RNA polymerase factor sigma-54 n=1 Tax=Paenibacillus humicus TaxID=412861 RepID=UPI003F18B156
MMMTGLELRQEQRLRLAVTPEIRQSIHMLTLPACELDSYVRELAAENPVLEYEGTRAGGALRSGRASSFPGNPLSRAAEAEPTLEAELAGQLRLLSLPRRIHQAAAYMAGNLNDDGYLQLDLGEIASELGLDQAEAEEALRWLQSLHPAGVGARSLQECLLLQIARDDRSPALAAVAVERHLDQLAGQKWEAVSSSLGLSRSKVIEIRDYIRGLSPRPCAGICPGKPQTIIPDARIERMPSGFRIELNASWEPRLSVDSGYGRLLGDRLGEAGAYLEACYRSAYGIMQSLEKRRRTIRRVLQAIMDGQPGFLEAGASALRPMTLADIAAVVQLHESTVSRAVSGKYVQTPHGVFSFRSFFSASLSPDGGDGTAAAAAKQRLKAMIGAENKAHPWSDQQLAALLEGEGIALSRRTVAKYREELRIPASSVRKRR